MTSAQAHRVRTAPRAWERKTRRTTLPSINAIATSDSRVPMENASFCDAILYSKWSFYRDRLGANIGKADKKWAFSLGDDCENANSVCNADHNPLQTHVVVRVAPCRLLLFSAETAHARYHFLPASHRLQAMPGGDRPFFRQRVSNKPPLARFVQDQLLPIHRRRIRFSYLSEA